MAETELLQIAQTAVRSTGELLQSLSASQRLVESKEQGGREFKLNADRRAHEHLAALLQPSGLPVLSEEDTSSHLVDLAEAWVIDPLDGSFNFLRGLGHCMVSCAYVVRGQPRLGVLFDVLTGDVYVGGREVPSTKNGELIRCSTTSALMSAVVCTGFPARFDFSSSTATSEYLAFMSRFGKVRMFGSAAYSLCLVATGAADVYMERSIMFWDVAAAIAVAEGAGAKLLTPVVGGSEPLSLVVAAESLQTALHELVA
jgi:myo-inositol-1(or 4)-monophosphatase